MYEYDGRLTGVEVEVSVLTMLTFDDLSRGLSDLNERIAVVRGSRSTHWPTMAAGPDCAIEVLVAVAMAHALRDVAADGIRKLVDLMVEDAYKGFRAWVVGLVRKARERDDSRPWNLGFTVGAHRFYFDGPLDEAEFLRGVEAMRRILADSPDDLVEGTRAVEPDPGGAGWYWHTEPGRWEPTPRMAEAMKRDRR